jgi:uncharacterized membrane protein
MTGLNVLGLILLIIGAIIIIAAFIFSYVVDKMTKEEDEDLDGEEFHY